MVTAAPTGSPTAAKEGTKGRPQHSRWHREPGAPARTEWGVDKHPRSPLVLATRCGMLRRAAAPRGVLVYPYSYQPTHPPSTLVKALRAGGSRHTHRATPTTGNQSQRAQGGDCGGPVSLCLVLTVQLRILVAEKRGKEIMQTGTGPFWVPNPVRPPPEEGSSGVRVRVKLRGCGMLQNPHPRLRKN